MSLGFGKQSGPATPSGPSEPPNGRPFFGGNFGARPPSPSPPVTPPFFGAAPLRSPSRGLEVLGNPHSPPFGSQSARPAAIPPFQSAGVHRSPNSLPSWDGRQNAFPKNYDTQAHQRPSAVTSFVLSRNSETSVTARVARFPDSKGIRSPPFLSKDESIRNSAQDAPRSQLITPRTESLPLSYADLHPFDGVEGSPNSLPSWDDRQNSLKNYDTQAHQRPSAVTSFVVSRNSGPSVTARVARFQESKGTRSPPFLSKDESIRNSTQGAPRSHLITPRTRSPPLSYADLHPFDGVEGHAVPSSGMDSRPKLLHAHAEPQAQQDPSLVSPFQGSYTSGRHFPLEYDDVQVPKRTRPSVSPAGLNTNSNGSFGTRDSRVQQRSLQSASNAVSKTAASNLTNIPVSKRTRSPPLLPEGQGFEENSYTTQDGTEREMQAKAKRLARFKVELSKSPQNTPNIVEPEVSANRHEQYNIERNKVVAYNSTESAMDGTDGNDLSESEGVESSGIIIGSCPDMCPESERGERERKGDLDQYERLEGDRNQTSMSLAVKKYNRTAERTATLIRPMPTLQKTIDYLLNLLNQPYNDRFLSIYNFLWDRMRAIRMDLRMQHIFNQEAITMLEQMRDLMHTSILNKTSVELFQLYDDHRKNGINIPTEKEFRGYYALLKLDKHPGYMVEPAELSLDLAKMTPEIRQTPEVLFARDVARACRTGNFIAFFRLARKASYLQACLMHAHFSKLRTQALASIHAGVQSHQGLPIADISKWLAMEEEEIESLSEYHGFILKSYQEPYIVKEGPFLNGDEDYPTKCSTLVNTKKSGRIVEDVLPSSQVTSLSANATKEIQRTKTKKPEPKILSSYVGNESPALHASAIKVIKSVPDVDHQMLSFESVLSPRDARKVPNFECVSSPKEVRQKQQIIPTPVFSSPQDVKQKQQMIGTPIFGQYSGDARVTGVPPSPWTNPSFKPQLDKVATMEKPNYDAVSSNPPEQCLHSGMEGMPWQTESRTVLQERFPVGAYSDGFEPPVGQTVVINELEEEETPDLHQEDENNDVLENYQHEEIAKAKFKLILRLWKRRSVKLRALREQRELAATAALNSLSLGPPIQLKTDQPSTSGNFDIDLVLRERYKKHGQSWSRLNVSDVVWDILGRRTPDARCLCWKTVVCSQMNNLEGSEVGQRSHVFGASPWLLSKLIPSANENDDEDLVRSSRGMSIWKKWDRGQSSSGLKCCLSVVKDASFDNLIECVSGASAILFLASESIPWKLQKVQLSNLLLTIPCGSCLPLLILTDLHRNDMADFSSIIVDNLGLHDLDKSRISSFMIVPLIENQEAEQFDGFYSDRRLREGLQWLASESPLQPILHHVTMRELVLTHVNSSLEALDNMKDYEVAPDKCILAFNEALNWSQEAIAAAVRANPSCWPCPEIALLEEFSDEYRVVERHCPNVGWSSMAKFESLKSALRDCRLPPFPEHISWLPGCYEEGKEIENLRDELENGLIGYLTHSSKMMSLALAMTEAHVMLQRSCRLERQDSGWYIVPNWVMIFRRIFNWRLMGLSNGTFSSTYILEGSRLDTNLGNVPRLGFEDILPSPYYLNRPSLDEIIEVSCRPLLPPRGQLMLEGGSTLPDTSINGEMYDEGSLTDDGQLAIDDVSQANGKLENANREMVVAGEVAKGAEALSMLIEQCNIVQNGVDERLSIYF